MIASSRSSPAPPARALPKVRYPSSVYLVRGNHEDREINARFGFQGECTRRLTRGIDAWEAANVAFDHLPVAALVGGRIICLHGGVGETLETLDQIRAIARPLPNPIREGPHAAVLRDILWSDPTDHDSVVGVKSNVRGEDMVEFGADRVRKFLGTNRLDLVVRAHQCVMVRRTETPPAPPVPPLTAAPAGGLRVLRRSAAHHHIQCHKLLWPL